MRGGSEERRMKSEEVKEQETTLKVTVVPRMTVAKYESKYFVGESFNMEKGEVRAFPYVICKKLAQNGSKI